MQAIVSQVTVPSGWNADRILDHHCQKWPEHRGDGRTPILRILLACSGSNPDDYSDRPAGGRLGVDDESWRELARAERAAGRDPNRTLAFSRIVDHVEAFEPNPDYADFARRMRAHESTRSPSRTKAVLQNLSSRFQSKEPL